MRNELRSAKKAAKALQSIVKGRQKLVFVFGYKQIEKMSPAHPEKCQPPPVGVATFKRQVRLLSSLGKLVSLDDVRRARNLSALNFVLLLDESFAALSEAQLFLHSLSIPYVVAVPAEAYSLSWSRNGIQFSENVAMMPVLCGSCLQTEIAGPEEIEICLDSVEANLEVRLGQRIAYLVVDEESNNQNLALDLTTILFNRDYRGVIWKAQGHNAISKPYEAQMMHLCYMEAPATSIDLIKVLLHSLQANPYRLVEQIRAENSRHEYEIIAGDDFSRVLPFENLVKEGKDYRSDLTYYRYLHSDNPYRTTPPDYYAVEASGRMESIIYKFPVEFSLGSAPVRGIYAAGWIKLPQANPWASGLLLLRLTRSEAIVGSYRPSRYSAQATRKWNRVAVQRYSIAVAQPWRRHRETVQSNVREYDAYCKDISPLTQALNERYAFTVARSAQYYRWRFDQYPLAQVRYFVLYREGRAVAYFVTHMKEQTLAVSDFYCPDANDFAALLNRVQAFCASSALRTVRIETSLITICDYLGATYRCAPQVFHNYYYFNPRLLETNQHWRKVEKDWSNLEFHETPACGDVLLK